MLVFILYFHVKSHSPLEIHEKRIFQQKVFLSTFALVLPVQRSSDKLHIYFDAWIDCWNEFLATILVMTLFSKGHIDKSTN